MPESASSEKSVVDVGPYEGEGGADLGVEADGVERTPSGIPGFDELLGGGLPVGRAIVVTGTAGSGKTLMAIHFAIDGARAADHGAVYVSFEEPASQLRQTMRSLGRDAEALEAEKKLAIVDAAPAPVDDLGGGEESKDVLLGDVFNLSGLVARIDAAAKRVNAGRVALDSLAGLAGLFLYDESQQRLDPHTALRLPLGRLIAALKARGLTVLVTAERDQEAGPMSRFALEEFVADGALLLRSNQHGERRRRTVEIKKLRSCAHADGESPVVIRPGRGLTVMPLSRIYLSQQSGVERTTSGVAELDRMTGGGFFRDSVVLVSGSTGTGKTLLSKHFAAGGAKCGEKSLFLAFEESREQIMRNARAFGIDLPGYEERGVLSLDAVYPESMTLEAHLLRIQERVLKDKPQRMVIDSLSAIERIGPEFAFRQFLIALAAFVKRHRVTTLLTAGGGTFGDEVQISEQHISTLNDTIVLLRYVDTQGRVERAMTLLKMRGSGHAREHRRYRIGNGGLQLSGPRGDAVRNIFGERIGPVETDPDPSAAPPAPEDAGDC